MPTTTTNYALNLPTVGSDDDQWGSYLNTNFTKIDTELKTLNDSIADQDLEELGNVVNTTPAEDQVLQFNGQNWSASTLSISDISGLQTALDNKADDSDLTGITTNPADGSISYAKLNTALQVQVDRILLTDDDATPTDNQILKYSTTDSKWKYADLPGSTIQTLSDVNTAALADDALLVYNSTAGEFQFESGATLRTTLGVDVSGTDNSTPVTLSGSLDYLTLSGQAITLQQVNLTTDVTDTLPVANGGTGSATASDARTALGLQIGVNTQAFDQALTDISNLAVTNGNFIVGDGTNWVAESGSTARASLGVSIGSQVQAWDQQLDDISALAVTDGNIIVGNGTTWVAESGATARASLGLTIGTDVEAYSSTNADYSDTTANFTGTLQNGGSNVLVDSDIGSTVQGYDANTAKLDATTSNFTGTLQNGGSNVVVDSDIGSSVQAYNADLSTIAGLSSADGNFIVGSASGWVAESGATVRTSLGLGTAATTASTDYATSAQGTTADSALQDVVSDTTPQLGGNLDVNGNSIVSASNGNIAITPNGTGNVSLGNFTFDVDQTVGTGQDNYVLTYDHSTTSISLEAATGGSGINNVVEDLSPQLGGNLDVNGNSIVSVSAGNIAITPDSTGKIVLDGLSWPTADGSANQVLKTDGAGNLSFVDQSGGGGVSDLEHADSITTAETISSGNHRFYVGPISFTNTVTLAGKMLIFDGLYNTTGTINITGTLHVRG